MNIITKKKKVDRLTDGIETILSMSDEEFDEVIRGLQPGIKKPQPLNFYYTTDPRECEDNEIQLGLEKIYNEKEEYIGRGYYGVKSPTIRQIFEKLEQVAKEVPENSRDACRIQQLLATRSLEAFKQMNLTPDGSNAELLDKLFEILSNNQTFEKFLNYEQNRSEFSINGKEIGLDEYLQYLADFFGSRDEQGKVSDETDISSLFNVPDLPSYKEKYSQILDTYNLERYLDPNYEFKAFSRLEYIMYHVVKEEEEQDWQINPELYDSVYSQIPDDLTLEEQALYIYCKLCEELVYDEGYFYRDKLPAERYSEEFSREHLESIKPGTPITCWDFSRIFAKFINEMDGKIKAVVIATDPTEGHYKTGFYTDKVSVMLEAINGKTALTNDLMKAKTGIALEGLEIISDKEGVLKPALEKVYPMVFGKEPKSLIDYVKDLRKLPKENTPNDLEAKLNGFLEIMKQNNISGNEATQTFEAYYSAGFFGERLNKVYVGKRENQDSAETYKRRILLRSKKENVEQGEASKLYLLDGYDFTLTVYNPKQVIERLDSGELVYEDDKRKMPGLDGMEGH